MAERYKPYQRQVKIGGSIAQPTQQSYAAERAAIQGYSDLASRAQQVSDFAFKKAAATAKREGAQFGAQNPEQTLAAYQGKPPDTVYANAAFAAAVDVGSVQIESAAREQIANAYLEAKRNKQDPGEFKTELEAIIDGYSAPLTEIDPVTSTKTRLKLQNYARAAYMDRAGDAIKEHQAEVDADALNLTESTGDELELMMTQDVANAGKVLETRLSDLRESLIGLGQTPKAVEKTIIATRDRAHLARVRSEFESALDSGKGATYLEKFKADRKRREGSALGIDDKVAEALVNSMESDIAGQVRLGRAEVKALHGDIKDGFKVLGKGGTISDAAVANLYAEASRLGDQSATARIDALNIENKIFMTIKSPEAAQGHLDNLEARKAQNQQSGQPRSVEASLAEMETIERAQRLRDHHVKQSREDPIAYLAAQIGGTPNPVDFSDPDSIAARFTGARAAARRYNVPTKYFTKDDKNVLKQIFADTNPDKVGQAQVVQNITAAAGANAPDVFAEIDGFSSAHDLAYVGGIGKNDLTVEFLQGKEIVATGTRLGSILGPGQVSTHTSNVLGSSLGYKERWRDSIESAAEAIYLQRHGMPGDFASFKEPEFQQIVQELLGAEGDTGGALQIGDKTVILPPDMERSEDALEDALEKLNQTKLDSDAYGVPVFVRDGEDVEPVFDAKDIAAIFTVDSLVPYGPGLYLIQDGGGRYLEAGVYINDPDIEETALVRSGADYILDLSGSP
jgi:hypothetical protein